MKTQRDLLKLCNHPRKYNDIKAILDEGVSPDLKLLGYPGDWKEMDNYKTPLGETLEDLYSEEHIEVVRLLLDNGADVNGFTHHTVIQTRSTPLGRALTANSRDRGMTKDKIQQAIVDLLLSRGADVNLLSEEDLAKFMEIGNHRLLELLLNAGLNPSRVAAGKTLLEYVISPFTCSWGDRRAEMAKLLINRGADLSVKDKSGKLIVHKASRSDIVNLLLEKANNILDIMTLHDKVIYESPKFVQELLSRGDDINILNSKGNTPLMETCRLGYERAAYFLINAGANMNIINSDGETALHIAMANAQSFSGNGCDYTNDERFPILRELYSRGAIPQLDKHGRTPLMRCHIASNDYATIRFCVKKFSKYEAWHYSFDPNEYAKAMHAAYLTQFGKQRHAFIDLPIKLNPNHIFIGKLSQIVSKVDLISREKLIIAKKDLLRALKCNNEIAANSILKSFPEININKITDKIGYHPLSIVIRSVSYSKNDCCPMLELLIAKSADINLPDDIDIKDTPLLACYNHHHAIDKKSLEFLLAHGANPNLGNINKITPLHAATRTFRSDDGIVEEVIEILLLQGADPDAISHKGKPLDMIVLSWQKNQIHEIFNKFQLQKDNIIDTTLDFVLSPKNKQIFGIALKNNLGIIIKKDDDDFPEVGISLSTLIANLQRRTDLSMFAKNKLAFLKFLPDDPDIIEKELSISEQETACKLIYSLYKADMDIMNIIPKVSHEFKDTKEMHNAATKIQAWIRRYLVMKNKK